MQNEYEALAVEIERQNAAFDEVKAALTQLGDVELHVPQALLDELDELAAPPRSAASFVSIHALRG